MKLSEERIVELVVAALATYSYPLGKAWALRDSLVAEGLCDVEAISRKDQYDVGNALIRAGYDRGGITFIISPRICSLMESVRSGTLDSLEANLEQGDHEAFCTTLEAVKGFGPKSALIAWELMAPMKGRGGRT